MSLGWRKLNLRSGLCRIDFSFVGSTRTLGDNVSGVRLTTMDLTLLDLDCGSWILIDRGGLRGVEQYGEVLLVSTMWLSTKSVVSLNV